MKFLSFYAGAGCILAAAIWGFAFVVVKDGLDYVGALYMMAFRFSVAAAALSLAFWRRFRKLNRIYIRNGAVLGGFLFCAYFFQTAGCNFTTPGKNAFLTTLYVVLVPLLRWPLFRLRPAPSLFAAAVLQAAGIGLLSAGSAAAAGFSLNMGDVLTLVCGVFLALQMVCQEQMNRRGEADDPVLLSLLEFISVAVLSWCAAPFYRDGGGFSLELQAVPISTLKNPRVLASMLYLGLCSTMLCYVLQNVGLNYLPAPLVSLLISFESVFGMLFSMLIPVNGGRERLSASGAAGCVLIFLAVLLAEGRAAVRLIRRRASGGGTRQHQRLPSTTRSCPAKSR